MLSTQKLVYSGFLRNRFKSGSGALSFAGPKGNVLKLLFEGIDIIEFLATFNPDNVNMGDLGGNKDIAGLLNEVRNPKLEDEFSGTGGYLEKEPTEGHVRVHVYVEEVVHWRRVVEIVARVRHSRLRFEEKWIWGRFVLEENDGRVRQRRRQIGSFSGEIKGHRRRSQIEFV